GVGVSKVEKATPEGGLLPSLATIVMSYPVWYGNVALYVPPAYFSPGWWPTQRLSCPATRVGTTTNGGVLPWGAACTSTLRRPTLSVARNRMYRESLLGPMLTDPAGGRQSKSPVYPEWYGDTVIPWIVGGV